MHSAQNGVRELYACFGIRTSNIFCTQPAAEFLGKGETYDAMVPRLTRAPQVRMELAEYIARVRVEEAESDLAEFERTHKFRKMKEDIKRGLRRTFTRPFRAMRRKSEESEE